MAKRERIDEGEQVSAQAIAQAHYGIAGEYFKRLMLEAFGFCVYGQWVMAAAGTQSNEGMEHFVAGTTARCAASLVGVNFKTGAYYFHRWCEIIAHHLA